jgi:hypothetical protein
MTTADMVNGTTRTRLNIVKSVRCRRNVMLIINAAKINKR